MPRAARKSASARPFTTSEIVPSPPAATTRSNPSRAAAIASSRAWPARSVSTIVKPGRAATAARSSASPSAPERAAVPAFGFQTTRVRMGPH
jgi:hypothetical protein